MSESVHITGRQIAAARVLAGIGQSDLAAQANVSVATLRRMEASTGEVSGMTNNVAAVRRALEGVGVEFTNGGQPGVRMRTGLIVNGRPTARRPFSIGDKVRFRGTVPDGALGQPAIGEVIEVAGDVVGPELWVRARFGNYVSPQLQPGLLEHVPD